MLNFDLCMVDSLIFVCIIREIQVTKYCSVSPQFQVLGSILCLFISLFSIVALW